MEYTTECLPAVVIAVTVAIVLSTECLPAVAIAVAVAIATAITVAIAVTIAIVLALRQDDDSFVALSNKHSMEYLMEQLDKYSVEYPMECPTKTESLPHVLVLARALAHDSLRSSPST